jgi:hypothetical protein
MAARPAGEGRAGLKSAAMVRACTAIPSRRPVVTSRRLTPIGLQSILEDDPSASRTIGISVAVDAATEDGA